MSTYVIFRDNINTSKMISLLITPKHVYKNTKIK